MESIGEILKEKRLELGFSLDDMSEKTKLSKIQLKAIEEGNISFFKDDLSYLTYFVRYYANTLGVNYNEIRAELDDNISGFTDTLSISKVQEMESIEKGIEKKRRKVSKPSSKMFKVDIASVALITLALAIVIGLLFVFVKVIIPSFQSDSDTPIVNRPVPPTNDNNDSDQDGDSEKPGETPGDDAGEKPGNTDEETPSTDLTVTKVDARTYDISNWTEDADFLFEVGVNVSTTLRFTLDGAVQPTPEAGVVYNPGESVSLATKATNGKVLEISLGYPLNNTISINGQEIELDASVSGSRSPIPVTFRFSGE